jgi:hypothetical protein
MRRRAGWVAVLALALALTACSSDGKESDEEPKPVDPCAEADFRLQFWPDGTDGNPRPHLILYPGAEGRTRQQDRIGYADAKQARGAVVCGDAGDFAPRVKQMQRKVRTTEPVWLVCRPGDVKSFSVPTSTPSPATPYSGMMQVRTGDRRVLYAVFTPTAINPTGRATLQYDSRVCEKVPGREF